MQRPRSQGAYTGTYNTVTAYTGTRSHGRTVKQADARSRCRVLNPFTHLAQVQLHGARAVASIGLQGKAVRRRTPCEKSHPCTCSVRWDNEAGDRILFLLDRPTLERWCFTASPRGAKQSSYSGRRGVTTPW